MQCLFTLSVYFVFPLALKLCASESVRARLPELIHHFLQDRVTIFQLTCRSGAWSLVPAFQNDKVYLSVF